MLSWKGLNFLDVVEAEEAPPRVRLGHAFFVREPLHHGIPACDVQVPRLPVVYAVPVNLEDPELLVHSRLLAVVSDPCECKDLATTDGVVNLNKRRETKKVVSNIRLAIKIIG